MRQRYQALAGPAHRAQRFRPFCRASVIRFCPSMGPQPCWCIRWGEPGDPGNVDGLLHALAAVDAAHGTAWRRMNDKNMAMHCAIYYK